MEAEKLVQLRDDIAKLKDITEQAEEASGKERQSLRAAARQINKTVSALQEDVLGSYSPDYMVCRDMGHNWRSRGVEMEGNILIRTLRCNRCTMVRVEEINQFGDLLHRKYDRPNDYAIPPAVTGRERYSKSFWRGLVYVMSRNEATNAQNGS